MVVPSVGYSFSPGGLLLPYHLGVIDALQFHRRLESTNPVAGSSAGRGIIAGQFPSDVESSSFQHEHGSPNRFYWLVALCKIPVFAGAIAAAVHGCGIDSRTVLEETIAISDTCRDLGGARGRLLLLLKETLYANIGSSEMEALNTREGAVAIAYKEIFPRNRPILQTAFADRDDLINSVCSSSVFPFFATNWPCKLDTYKRTVPRLVVDGFFTVDRDRFGCPDFQSAGIHVDRTVTISVFPQQAIGLNASQPEDCIIGQTPALLFFNFARFPRRMNGVQVRRNATS